MNAVTVRDAKVFLSGREILHNISWEVKRGERCFILGANGAGKTTLIKKMITEAYAGQKLVLIENEFGDIAIIAKYEEAEEFEGEIMWLRHEYLVKHGNPNILNCLRLADVLIDGPYIEAERDITLPMRGSRNQRVIDLSEKI